MAASASSSASSTSSASSAMEAALEAALEDAAQLVASASRVVIMTGAGVSASSGIATFRGTTSSIWSGVGGKLGLLVYGTPFGWGIAPAFGWSIFLEHFYRPIAAAEPNAAHFALAELPDLLPRARVAIITQNVDGLHQRAGSPADFVFEIHGTVQKFVCIQHRHRNKVAPEFFERGAKAPRCTTEGCDSYLRPNAVLFTEALPPAAWSSAAAVCNVMKPGDVMIVVGTSGTVQPAASLPIDAAAAGAHIIECNLTHTPLTSAVEDRPDRRNIFLGGVGAGAAVTLPKLVERVRALKAA